MRGIEDRLADDGYTALIVNTDNDAVRERSHLEAMRARQVDGFISATARLDTSCSPRSAPAACRSCWSTAASRTARCRRSTVDDRAGHRARRRPCGCARASRASRISPARRTCPPGHRRYLGFLDAMRAAGLEVPGPAVQLRDRSSPRPRARRACAELLDPTAEFTAIVAANDLLALGCYDTLPRAGCAAREDVSVVGFNDMPFIDRLRPPLTSVRVPAARDRRRGRGPAAAALADPAARRARSCSSRRWSSGPRRAPRRR